MSEELKPCPFCGCNAYIDCYDHSYTATCGNCFAELGKFEIKEDCIKAWNNRPIEDEKDREIARLNEALKQIDNIATGEHILGLFEYQFRQIDNIIKSLGKDNDVPADDTDNNGGSMEKEQ